MFEVGAYVMYGTFGVYSVEGIRNSPIDKNDTRLFYELKPLRNGENSKAFVPADSEHVFIRPVMTREVAERFVGEELPVAEVMEITNERERKNGLPYGDRRSYAAFLRENYPHGGTASPSAGRFLPPSARYGRGI